MGMVEKFHEMCGSEGKSHDMMMHSSKMKMPGEDRQTMEKMMPHTEGEHKEMMNETSKMCSYIPPKHCRK